MNAYPKLSENNFCTFCHKKSNTKSNGWFLKIKDSKNQTNGKYKQNSYLCFEMNKDTPE